MRRGSAPWRRQTPTAREESTLSACEQYREGGKSPSRSCSTVPRCCGSSRFSVNSAQVRRQHDQRGVVLQLAAGEVRHGIGEARPQGRRAAAAERPGGGGQPRRAGFLLRLLAPLGQAAGGENETSAPAKAGPAPLPVRGGD